MSEPLPLPNWPRPVLYECVESRRCPGEWHVEAIDHVHEGIIYAATFSGHFAEERAREYAYWRNSLTPRILQHLAASLVKACFTTPISVALDCPNPWANSSLRPWFTIKVRACDDAATFAACRERFHAEWARLVPEVWRDAGNFDFSPFKE